MAVIDERYRSARDVGGPALGHYLGAFMKEREAMNAEDTPDLSKLVAAEADARDRIARLRERQAMLRGKKEEMSVRSSDKAAELKTKILVANIAAGAKITSADRQFRLGMQKLYSDRAEVIAKKMEIPNEVTSVIESATATSTDTVDTVAARRAAMEKAGANEGTQEADVIDRAIWKGLVARDTVRNTNDADTYAGEHFGRNGNVVVNPDEYMYRMYSVKSPKEAEDDAKRVSKEIGGSGGDTNLVDGWLKDGSLPSMGSETQTRERSSGPVDPEQADALEKAIGDLTNYADGLAAQRSAAGSRRYPKGHSFLLNPNTFTEQEGWDALGVYSENTAGYNEEVGVALAQAGGDPRKAYAALASQGGINDDRGRDYAPDLVDDGLDISKWLVGEVEKVSKPLVVRDGEWTYEVKDGVVTITTAPAANRGAVGKTYTAEKDKDSPVFKKIADHINKSPELAERAQARKALEAQPVGVRRLFTGVFELADNGEYDEAKKAANSVSSDDVRFAYGEALQEDPGAAANGIRALPEDVLGTAGESVLRALDAPSKTPIDVAAIQGNLRGLGGALLVAQDPDRVARKKAQAEQDRAGTSEMRTGGRSGSYQKGQEAGAKMVADTRSGWDDEAPPQPLAAQNGEWTYQMNRDGSVTVLATPANGEASKGRTFTSKSTGADGEDYASIVDLFSNEPEKAERVRAFKEWKPKPPASLKTLLDTFDPKRSEYEAGVHAALTSALANKSTTDTPPASYPLRGVGSKAGAPGRELVAERKPQDTGEEVLTIGAEPPKGTVRGADIQRETGASAPIYGEVDALSELLTKHNAVSAEEKTYRTWPLRQRQLEMAMEKAQARARARSGSTGVVPTGPQSLSDEEAFEAFMDDDLGGPK